MKHRRKSVAADPEGLRYVHTQQKKYHNHKSEHKCTENRKSLIEGKIASQKLKAINDQIDNAKDQGLPVSHLEE